MKSDDFYKLAEYLSSLQYTQEQIMMLKHVVDNLTVAYYEKADNGYHIGAVASQQLDMMIQEGASLTECMRECNVSKTTVLRHRKKLQKQKEEEQKQRELEEQRKQETPRYTWACGFTHRLRFTHCVRCYNSIQL